MGKARGGIPISCPGMSKTVHCFDIFFRLDVSMKQTLEAFLEGVRHRDPHQPEFHQAVTEVMESLWPFIEQNPKYADKKLLERLVEPERIIQFRVSWVDDNGEVQVNRGYRIQHSSMKIGRAHV